jgi:hypothetical protein
MWGRLANLRADWQSAQLGRVNNPPQDGILLHSGFFEAVFYEYDAP